jgi:hypothetical protein
LFTDDFTGSDGDSFSPEWTSGATNVTEILNNEGYFSGNPSTYVVGTDLSSSGISTQFTISVDFRMPSNNGWGGLWFMGTDNSGAATGGYYLRFRTTDGMLQAGNFVSGTTINTGGWSGNATVGALAIDGTRYQLQLIAGLDADGTTGIFDATLINLDTSTTVGSHQFTRVSAFSNPATGGYFGLYSQGSSVRFDNYSVAIPEPATIGLYSISSVGILMLRRLTRTNR